AEPFTIEIMAAVAAQERRLISRRTKDALAAAKARGVKLGGYRHEGSTSRTAALDRAEALRPTFAELADLSRPGVAQVLNGRARKADVCGAWSAVQVMRVRKRLGETP